MGKPQPKNRVACKKQRIIRENLKTLELMNFTEDERPIGFQIFGEDAEVVGKSAKIIYDLFPRMI